MRVYFSGIGGVGIGPLAEITADAGIEVIGSDLADSLMVQQLQQRGIEVELSQDGRFLAAVHEAEKIDWFVHTAALPETHPELAYARANGMRVAKRDELLSHIINLKNMRLIAISGTHGKTTTTGMMIWALQQSGTPVSYSVGSTLSFGPSGRYVEGSEYFVYECDEFDRNMLHFEPHLSLITTLGYDHTDTYKTQTDYIEAFSQFVRQSKHTIGWHHDLSKLDNIPTEHTWLLQDSDLLPTSIAGEHNRRNATLVLKSCEYLRVKANSSSLENFPGTNRRFEKLAENLYSDYGHHPVEIAATLQLANELSENVVLVYQPHQNVRQHEVKNQYTNCFKSAKNVYWLSTYLSREDPDLPILTPQQVSESVKNKEVIEYAELNDELWQKIKIHINEGALVLCMGAGSIDSWVRRAINNN